jgi:cytochrome c
LPHVAGPGEAFAQAVPASARDGIYTQTQAGQGEGLYMQGCMSCHGDKLQGGENIPALAGASFLSKWGKLSVGSLCSFISTQMPLGRLGSLGNTSSADVVAYILSVDKMPAGQKMLRADVKILNEVKVGSP